MLSNVLITKIFPQISHFLLISIPKFGMFSTFKFNRILYVCLSMYMFNLIYHLVLYHTCSKKAVKKRNNKHIENMSL